jgi:hypothetical protein
VALVITMAAFGATLFLAQQQTSLRNFDQRSGFWGAW